MRTVANQSFVNDLQLVVGLFLGLLIMWMLISAGSRWQRGKGLRRVPDRVRRESDERLWQAKSDQAQGCREMMRAAGEFAVTAVIVFVLGLFLGG